VNIRQFGLFVLLLLVVVGTGWFLDKQGGSRLPASASASGPDSFVEDINLAVMDDAGHLKYRVMAEYMTHFPNQELLTLRRPDINIVQPDGSVWQIQSERGETTTAGDRTWLLGKVTIQRPATATSGAIHIVTRDLLIKPEEDLAETESAATITGDRYVIKSVGLRADFKTRVLELLSRVKTTIDGKDDGNG